MLADWGIYAYGKSKATLKINGAAGVYGSTIKSYSITTDPGIGSASSSSLTTSTIYKTGTITVTAKVTDSRGRSATQSTTFSVYSYGSPYFSSIEAYRCTSSGARDEVNGTYARLLVSFACSALSGSNKVTGQVVLAQVGGSYTTSATLTSGTALILGGGNLAVDATYKATLTLTDGGENPNTTLTGIDKYRLYLDFTGGSEPVDVLFVLDNTSSMETKMDNNSTRAQVLNKIMNGENGQAGIVNQVLAMHPENKVAVIGFGGDYGKYSTYGDVSGTVLLDWTDKSIGYKNFYIKHNGTMFEAGLIRAYELLSNPTVATDGHMKIMLFMSDGEPNAYAEPIMDAAGNVVDYNFYGGKTLANCESHIRREIDRLTAAFPGLNVYTIGVSSDVSPATQTLLTDMTRGSGSFAQADSASAFVEAMQDVINSLIPHGLTITDTLSQYVQLCETQPDIKLTQRDKNGDEVILWQADTLTPNADGSIGTVTQAGGNIADSVTVSGRTITAKLNQHIAN